MIPMPKRRMFNKFKLKNLNGKGIKRYSMEEPIITFGSESLIIEMFPESIHKPMPEPLPEPLPESIPHSIVQISPEPEKRGWCVLS
jgi:hypothetical protein